MAVKPNKLLNAQVVFTANRLLDGRVIWLKAVSPEPVWSDSIADAQIFPGSDYAAAEAAAAVGDKAQYLVGAYAVAVTLKNGAPVPTRVRELIRVTGPSAGSTRPRQVA